MDYNSSEEAEERGSSSSRRPSPLMDHPFSVSFQLCGRSQPEDDDSPLKQQQQQEPSLLPSQSILEVDLQPHDSPLFRKLWAAATAANRTMPNTELGHGSVRSQICDSPSGLRFLERSSSFSSSMTSGSHAPPHIDHNPMHLRRRYPASSADFTSPATFTPSIPPDCGDCNCGSGAQAGLMAAAGGAAGEDRVQVVYDAERSLLFAAIYDGFDGRDAADFLSTTLYRRFAEKVGGGGGEGAAAAAAEVEGWLREAMAESEASFLEMVESFVEEMPERQDLARVGACVAALVLYGGYLYTVNVGDSRALLATTCASTSPTSGGGGGGGGPPRSLPLTVEHSLANHEERRRLESLHPGEPSLTWRSKVKGKLDVTRAIGAGYLKQRNLNEKLLGRLKVQDLISPPYITVDPHVSHRRIKEGQDKFIVIGSDGLFGFFSNDEVVKYVNGCLRHTPPIDPARFLITHTLIRAARQSGLSLEELRKVAYERKRAYHDDVSVVVVALAQSYNNIQCPS